jgi:4-hydroxy-2-oxoheptanedioate aldolase
VYIGPADLALALGLPARGDTDEPVHLETVGRILATCRRHRVPCGIHTGGLAWAKRRLQAGFDFVTLGSDIGFMMQAAASDLAAARGVVKPAGPATAY